ncbi:MAG: ATP-binding protein [Acidobacteria bacterium]|nr:ATP-binding protein [Acidobacteriota bacterium]
MDERRFPAVMDSLREIIPWILACGKEAGLPDSVLFQVELACEEAFVNVICYSYPDTFGEVSVQVKPEAGHFEVRILDNGVLFNPVQMTEPDTSLPVAERKPGGLGILMIKKMTDEISYSREKDRNCLILTWHVKQNERGTQ